MSKPILIIDPGHGGRDPGGGSNKHWKEKDKVLDISLYQYKRFKELGVKVAITRTTDKYLSSAERTKIVRDSGATYCISNHINAGGGDGAEVIHSIYDNGSLARTIANELKATGQNLRRVFTRTYTINGKKYDYYFMNRETGKVITQIVEYGFADSPKDDVQQLKDHIDEAEAVVKAFCKHIGHKYVAPGKKETPKSSSNVHTVVSGDTLWGIAQKYNTTVAVLKQLNGLSNDLIHPGQKIKLPGASESKQPSFKVGNKVKVKSSAKKYATGEPIPSWVKGKSYTIQQVKTDRVLLKEILSWVYKKDVE